MQITMKNKIGRTTHIVALLYLFVSIPVSAEIELTQVDAEYYDRNDRTLAVIALLLIFIIIGGCIWVYRHRMLMKKLLRLAKELRAARADVIRANNVKDLFVKNISHEIRTPLNAIVGFSQLLGSSEHILSASEKREYASYVENNALMLTRLIDDLMNVADIENGTFEIMLTPNDSQTICEAALSSVKHRVKEGVKLVFDYQLEPHTEIKTDALRVQQLLTNFLTNACKHTDKGTITLKCEPDVIDDHILFSVTDTGDGISGRLKGDIFERFVKLDDTKQGSGLGLYICHNIARRLNGRVWCDIEYNDGARFCFSLPVSDEPSNKPLLYD